MLQVIKLRLRDRHTAVLNRQAKAVNVVWNYCNEVQQRAARSHRKFLNYHDLQKLTAGSSTLLDLHSHTIQQVAKTYDRSRSAQHRAWLRFRGAKSLGWVPFNTGHVSVVEPGSVKFRGIVYETMHWRELPAGTVIRAGSFNQDARGRWYINMAVEIEDGLYPRCEGQAVGIDLGLKSLVTLSNGERVEAPRNFRLMEQKLRRAQRARKVRLLRSISAKIANSRRDHLHKTSARIALAHETIIVGAVSSKKLVKTRMAKSVLDAGWSTLRRQLSYKAMRHGGKYLEVNEAYTTQTCSSCGSLPPERPTGIAGLGIREWKCGDCGAVHDRDVNAAKNILRVGLDTLAEGACP